MAVVLLLLIYCLMYLPLFVGVLYVLSSFAIILTRKRELVSLLLLSFVCLVTVNVLWPWIGLQCVVVDFLIILIYFL